MKRHTVCLGLALALVGCAQVGPTTQVRVRTQSQAASAMSVAVAQGDRAQFRKADQNGDGALTPTELSWLSADAFKGLDANHDGRLSFDEATAQSADAEARAKQAEEFARAAAGQAGDVAQAVAAGEPAVSSKRGASHGNPIILVPGYLDLPAYFIPITKKLQAQGRDVTYLGLFPNIADIRQQAAALNRKVAEVQARTGAQKVDIIGHSMGGLISRYFIKELGGKNQVARLIQLATPNHGTIVSYLGPSEGANQMHPGSAFLNALNADDETPGDIAYTSIRGGLDEIVIPHDSPILDGAENNFCRFAAHGSIFIDPSAWKFVDAALKK